jgi:hypothetical protein
MSIKIQKQQTGKEYELELVVNGAVVGSAEAIFKTRTQKTWTCKIILPLARGDVIHMEREGCGSVAKFIKEVMDELGNSKVAERLTQTEKERKLKAAERGPMKVKVTGPPMSDLVQRVKRMPEEIEGGLNLNEFED